MGNNQGIENNFKIQAKKQRKKQMPISMLNVTSLLTPYSGLQSSSSVTINDPSQFIYVIMLLGPVCVKTRWPIPEHFAL